MVLFDIPETQKKIRDSLRKKLKKLGFLEFQKSVFIFQKKQHKNYKKDNPKDQSFHTTDVSRLNYIVKEIINDTI